jgi:hypothetical protein
MIIWLELHFKPIPKPLPELEIGLPELEKDLQKWKKIFLDNMQM